jgi:hypothetical protein
LPGEGVVPGCCLRPGWFGFGVPGDPLGEATVFGACGVKVAFRAFGADAQRVSGFLQCVDAGAGGGGELF